jgi:hypothetical protein
MRGLALAAAGYVACAAVLSWPLPLTLGTHLVDPMTTGGGVWGRADLDLVVWILAWGAHALASAPLALFDANIFHPASNALAASEHLLGLAPVAAPVFLATGNAVLAYNVTELATVVVAGLATFALVRDWTHDPWAAFAGGVAFAFAPINLVAWTRPHETAVHLLPLVLLLAFRAAARPRPATLLALAAATALQGLAGVYVAFELVALLVAAAPFVWWEARQHGGTGTGPAAAVAAGLVALVPVALPYARARAAGLLFEGVAEMLAPLVQPDVLVGLVVGGIGPGVVLFAIPGVLCGAPVRLRRACLLAVAAMGFWLALGPDVPGPYAAAVRYVPGFASVRAPMRFLVLPVLAAAVLGACGVAALAAAIRPRIGHAATAGLVLAGTAALALGRGPRPPLALVEVPLRGPGFAVDRWLAEHGAGRPVLALPACNSAMDGDALLATGRAMVGSTLHWLPLVNGYSGHPPPSDRLLMTLAQRLPDAAALADLCDLSGVGWLVVRTDSMPVVAARIAAAAASLGLEVAARFGSDVVYRVARPCGARASALVAQMTAPDDGRSLGGVPRRPLPESAMRGRITGEVPRLAVSGFHGWFWVDVRNAGDATWPGLSARAPGRVGLAARWRDPATGGVVLEGFTVPLARDLPPGGHMLAQVETMIPPSGRYRLEIGLVQEGQGWFADRPGGAGILRRRVRARTVEELR